MAQQRKFGSEYEELIMTTQHPKLQQHKLAPPPYYDAASPLREWISTRKEEVVVVLFMACCFVYCAGVYSTGYYAFVRPLKAVLGNAWDAAVLAFAFLKFAPVDRKLKKKSRMPEPTELSHVAREASFGSSRSSASERAADVSPEVAA